MTFGATRPTGGRDNYERLIHDGYVTQHMRRTAKLIRSRIRHSVPVTDQQREFAKKVQAVLAKTEGVTI